MPRLPQVSGGRIASLMTDHDPPINFDTLLTRADDVVLQELIGADIIRLLRSIDPILATPTKLRDLLSHFKTPLDLLRDTKTRNLILDFLPTATAERLSQHLGLDPNSATFAALQTLSLPKGSQQEARFLSFFGQAIPPEDDLALPPRSLPIQASYQLFAHQRRAVSDVQRLLSSSMPRVLLHMPTGSGKTRTALNVVADHLRTHEPTLVLWLAFSDELCEQAIEEFQQAWSHLGNRHVEVLRFWGSTDPNVQFPTDGFVVAGLGKTYNYAINSIASIATLADKTSLLVIDEAHQSVAPTYQLLLDLLVQKQPTTGLLGLSATPGRTWNDIDQDQKLADLFFRQKVGLTVAGFANPVDYLITEQYLARPVFSSLFYNSGEDISPEDLNEIENSLDIPHRLLDRLAKDDQRNLGIINRTEDAIRTHRRTILFAASVAHAVLLAAILRARGIESHAITANTPIADRRHIITTYRGPTAQPIVLCNYGVLTAGFDAPETSAAIIARPTKSLVLYSQMMGRALRGPLAGGNTEAEIITVIDTNLPGFGNLSESFFNWEDVWT